MISLRLDRGLSDGQVIRPLLREFVRVVEAHELIQPTRSSVIIEVVPSVLVHGALGFFTDWPDTDEQTIQIAGRDFMRPRNRAEIRERDAILRDRPELKRVPWPRRVVWTLTHELVHCAGEMDEDKADDLGEQLLEAARSRSRFLRAGTRRT